MGLQCPRLCMSGCSAHDGRVGPQSHSGPTVSVSWGTWSRVSAWGAEASQPGTCGKEWGSSLFYTPVVQNHNGSVRLCCFHGAFVGHFAVLSCYAILQEENIPYFLIHAFLEVIKKCLCSMDFCLIVLHLFFFFKWNTFRVYIPEELSNRG